MKYKLRKSMVAVMAGSLVASSIPMNAMATESVDLTGDELLQFLESMEEDEPTDLDFLALPEEYMAEMEDEYAVETISTGDWVTVDGIEGGRIQFDSESGTITDAEDTITSANIPR